MFTITIKGKGRATLYQQGDVPIIAVAAKFGGKPGKAVLALGEVTGHAHVIDDPRARLTKDADVIAALRKELIDKGVIESDAMVEAGLVVEGDMPVRLTHEEHDTIEIPPGRYAVLGQREYTPGALRRVSD